MALESIYYNCRFCFEIPLTRVSAGSARRGQPALEAYPAQRPAGQSRPALPQGGHTLPCPGMVRHSVV